MQPSVPDEGKIKQLMEEAIEDIALTNAIRQGTKTESVSRNEIFDSLKGRG